MPAKIKWNDDRVRGTAVALLLLSRAKLAQGTTSELVASALVDYRADPDGYKAAFPKRDLAAAKELGPLKNPRHVEYFQKLTADVDRQLAKMEKNKRQFNSLVELDNFLAFTLPAID